MDANFDPRHPPQYRLLYEFRAAGEEEMSGDVGEVVRLWAGPDGVFQTEDDTKDGWLLVESVSVPGKHGFVPVTFVERMPDDPRAAPAAPAAEHTPAGAGYGQPMASSAMGPSGGGRGGGAGAGRGLGGAPGATYTPSMSSTRGTPAASSTLGSHTGLSRLRAMTPATSASGAGGLGGTGASPLRAKMLAGARKAAIVGRATGVGVPRAPALVSAVQSEDFNELFKRNEDYFKNLQKNRTDTFQLLSEMVGQLGTKIQHTTNNTNELVKNLTELDDLIDEERRNWKQRNEVEKNDTARGRSGRGAEGGASEPGAMDMGSGLSSSASTSSMGGRFNASDSIDVR